MTVRLASEGSHTSGCSRLFPISLLPELCVFRRIFHFLKATLEDCSDEMNQTNSTVKLNTLGLDLEILSLLHRH